MIAAQNEPTLPVEAAPDQALHVHFARGGGQEQVVAAFGALREIIHERPGATKVVLHVPTADGRLQRMDLRVGCAPLRRQELVVDRLSADLAPRSVTLRLEAPSVVRSESSAPIGLRAPGSAPRTSCTHEMTPSDSDRARDPQRLARPRPAPIECHEPSAFDRAPSPPASKALPAHALVLSSIASPGSRPCRRSGERDRWLSPSKPRLRPRWRRRPTEQVVEPPR